MIQIDDAWTHPGLPWLSDLVARHQSIIDRRLGHGDLKRWSEAMSRIPSMDPASRTLGRAVGLAHIPEKNLDLLDARKINVTQTLNLASQAKKNGISRRCFLQ